MGALSVLCAVPSLGLSCSQTPCEEFSFHSYHCLEVTLNTDADYMAGFAPAMHVNAGAWGAIELLLEELPCMLL